MFRLLEFFSIIIPSFPLSHFQPSPRASCAWPPSSSFSARRSAASGCLFREPTHGERTVPVGQNAHVQTPFISSKVFACGHLICFAGFELKGSILTADQSLVNGSAVIAHSPSGCPDRGKRRLQVGPSDTRLHKRLVIAFMQ